MVSIIILTFKNLGYIMHCLETLVNNPNSAEIELVIVSNNATPEILNFLKTFLPDCGYKYILVELDKNLGVTGGRNAGINAATGDYLMFLDDDAYAINPGWLDAMLEYFTGNVGIVGQTGYYIVPEQPGVFWEAKGRGTECDVVQGYCFLFKREVVNAIGGLDPFFDMFWHEESEYCLRAKAAGFKVIDTDMVGIVHVGSGSGDDGTYGKKIEYMFKKWKSHFGNILVPKAQRKC